MKKFFGFKDGGNNAVFTIIPDRDIFLYYEHNGRLVYHGKWKKWKGHNGALLKFCLEVNAPLLQGMHDLLAQMGH